MPPEKDRHNSLLCEEPVRTYSEKLLVCFSVDPQISNLLSELLIAGIL